MSLVLNSAGFGYSQRAVLTDLNVCFQCGIMTAVLGGNGVGKSTLLKGMLGLVPCLSGQVLVDDDVLSELSPGQLATRLAYLEQQADCHWPLTTRKVVELGRFPHHQSGSTTAEKDREIVSQAMQITDVERFSQRSVKQLSGGEKARVMLARALAVDAPALLVDEPVAGLDPQHQLTVLQQLKSWASRGRTLLVVLHDINLALRFCARTLLILPGGGVIEGETQQILNPENIARAFNISVISGRHQQQDWLVPWAVVPPASAANTPLSQQGKSVQQDKSLPQDKPAGGAP